MRLGYIRIPDQHATSESYVEIRDQLTLADDLNFHVAYLPQLDPQVFLTSRRMPTTRLKIAFDATAFGPLAPSALEQSVRRIDRCLGEKLCLGVEMSCENASTKTRSAAQAFETMFSHDPRYELTNASSCFPMKPPCPNVIGVPNTGAREEVARAAARGYFPMSPSWLPTQEIAHHWPAIVQGATSALRRARPSHWQLARMIVVHDEHATIDAYVYGANSPIRRYFTILAKRGVIDGDVDAHMKSVVIAGSVEKVAKDILTLREAVGEFGTLHIVAPPDHDSCMTHSTMMRLAKDVVPIVDKSDAPTLKKLETT